MINLANDQNSLARFSARTNKTLSLLPLAGEIALSRLIGFMATWFQALFTSPQRCFSVFGHPTITLSDSEHIQGQRFMPPVFPRDFQHMVLRIPRIILFSFLLQGYHLLWHSFPSTFESREQDVPGSKLHISSALQQRIRFTLYRFRSPLLTVSRLISFPSPNRMLYFGEFPNRAKALFILRQDSHSEINGSQAPCASPLLIAAWYVLHRCLSLAIPQVAWSKSSLHDEHQSRTHMIGIHKPLGFMPFLAKTSLRVHIQEQKEIMPI